MGFLQVSLRKKVFSEGSAPQIGSLEIVVESRKVIAVLGPSGAGKSTLLRIIAGLDLDYEGQVLLDGERIAGPSRRVQMAFQDNLIVPWLTVSDNLRFVGGPVSAKEKCGSVEHVLRMVGLLDRAEKWPKVLSGGEESRLSLARVLYRPGRFVLLDEPFRNLDIVTRWAMQDLLIETLNNTGAGALIVSHSIRDAVFLSDEVLVVSGAPMRIEKRFRVGKERPRVRSAAWVSSLTTRISEFMLEQGWGLGGRTGQATKERGEGRGERFWGWEGKRPL